MLEELDSCQVRDMYYCIYLTWLLSRHCGWLVWGAPLCVPRPEEDGVCIGHIPAKHREHSVGPLGLVRGLCWRSHSFPLWEVAGDGGVWRLVTPVTIITQEKVSALSSYLLASHSHPVFPYFSHTQPALGLHAFSSPCIYPGSTLAIVQLLLLSDEKNVRHFTEALPAPTGTVTKPAFLPLSPHTLTLALITLSSCVGFTPFSPSEPLEGRAVSYLYIPPGTEKLRAKVHK